MSPSQSPLGGWPSWQPTQLAQNTCTLPLQEHFSLRGPSFIFTNLAFNPLTTLGGAKAADIFFMREHGHLAGFEGAEYRAGLVSPELASMYQMHPMHDSYGRPNPQALLQATPGNDLSHL